jgi:hypothetical protein
LQLGLEQATASRYQTFALLFWCCLGLLLLVRLAVNPVLLQILAAVLLLMMLGFATQVRLPLIDAQWHQLRQRTISMALLTGVQDPAVLADAYPDPQVVPRVSGYMEEHQLSIFSGKEYAQIGQALNYRYHVVPSDDCSGYVSSSQLEPAVSGRGMRLTGFAWDRQSQRPVQRLIATADGRIAGMGSNIAIPLTLVNARPQADPSRYGWVTFVRESNSGSKIQLYAVTGKAGSGLCQFADISP